MMAAHTARSRELLHQHKLSSTQDVTLSLTPQEASSSYTVTLADYYGMIHCLTFLSQHIVLTLQHCQQKRPRTPSQPVTSFLILSQINHSFFHHVSLNTNTHSPLQGCPLWLLEQGFINQCLEAGFIVREAADGTCVCMACVWRQHMSLPRAQTVILVRCMSNI